MWETKARKDDDEKPGVGQQPSPSHRDILQMCHVLTASLVQVINLAWGDFLLTVLLYRDKSNPAIILTEQGILIPSPSGRKKATTVSKGFSFDAALLSLQSSNVLAFAGIKPSLTMTEERTAVDETDRRLK